jgi:uncharacterized protein with NRDE domain
MCLLVLAWQMHPRYRLVVAANRDEFHARPAASLAKWPPPNDILAGRDLRAGGTWFAVDRQRRFGVVTNFRDLQGPRPNSPSRGQLIPRYLSSSEDGIEQWLSGLEAEAAGYSGFNLLLSENNALWYASNRAERFARPLPPGVYGLSNELLDTPWPKLRRVRARFESWLKDSDNGSSADLFSILNDRTVVTADHELPRTGLSAEWERVLSAPFVVHPDYGTRCSTVLLLGAAGDLILAERRFDAVGHPSGETEFSLNAGEWPAHS